MIDKHTLQTIHNELDELNAQLADPAIYATSASRRIVNRQRELTTIIEIYDDLKKTETEIESTKGMLLDSEMAELAEHELEALRKKHEQLSEQLTAALVPSDPNDGRNAIIEIRAGAGGDESSLFAGEMMRMYSRYAETHNLKIELLSESPNEVGGYKEIIFQVNGENAYRAFKYESGVHRVQRIPATESAGRIHTSTVTVAVLPEAEEEDLVIDPNELRIDVYRSSGHGGQSVNTTDSAVRITHLPSGIVVTCQDEKSQLKNKTKALSVLRSRLLAIKEEEERKSQGEARLAQIGSGDRSEKIRTYNFPQDRLTDHRIGYTTHNLTKIMDGELGDLFDALHQAYVQNYIDQQK